MDFEEKRDRGLLLRFRSSELEEIDRARGALSRGRWVRQLVLDGLAARGELTVVASEESLLSRVRVSGSPGAQLRPARSLVDPSKPSTPLPGYAARRVAGGE